MSLVQQIKNDILASRKASESQKVIRLSTFLAEAEAVGKNKGNRESTDAEVIAVAKKFINNLNEIELRLIERKTNESIAEQADLKLIDSDVEEKIADIMVERGLYEKYIPQQLTEAELRDLIGLLVSKEEVKTPKLMGNIMKYLKTYHDGNYDGKSASELCKQILEGML